MKEKIIELISLRNGFVLDLEDMEELADEILALFDENNRFIDGKCKYCGEPAVYCAECSIHCLDGF